MELLKAALTALFGCALLGILFWRRSGSCRIFKTRIPGVPDQPVIYNIQEGKGIPSIPGRVAKALLMITHSVRQPTSTRSSNYSDLDSGIKVYWVFYFLENKDLANKNWWRGGIRCVLVEYFITT